MKLRIKRVKRTTPSVEVPRFSGEVNEDLLVASICRESFYEFIREFWSVVIPETPVWNWHIKFICDEVQKVAERVMRGEPKLHDVLINVPPGTTKSTILSVMLPAWVWTRMPSARFICGSYADRLALDLSRKCRDIIRSDKYERCFPDIRLRSDQDSKEHFANTKGGGRYSVGVGGVVIGHHGHFLIVDDPIDPMGVTSDALLKQVNQWMTEQLGQRKVDKSVSVMLLIMQRLHQDDPAGNMLDRAVKGDPLLHVCLPAERSDKVRPAEAVKWYGEDGLLDPVRLSRTVLDAARRGLGDSSYAGQYEQHPVPPGGSMFKIDKLIHVPSYKIPSRFKQMCRFWDKAATQGAGAWTVGAKVGLDDQGYYWILHLIRERVDSGTREKIILQTAHSDGRGVIVGVEQEPGSGGKESAEGTVRRLAGFRTRIIKPTGSEQSKVARADPLSTMVNSGNVYLVEAPWNRVLLDEMMFFPFSRYKDIIDGLSGAFTVLSQPRLEVGAI